MTVERAFRVERITSEQEYILRNLLQAYEAEFSPITQKNPDASGLYPLDTPLDTDHDAYLLYVGKIPSGFAIVGKLNGRTDLSKFYVIPTQRGASLGRKFAHAVFDRYAGDWQVRQIEGAQQATEFWRKAIGDYTEGDYTEQRVEDIRWGTITVQYFCSRKK